MHNGKLKRLKTEKWLSRNSIQNNEDYIIKILDYYNVTKYKFIPDSYGDENIIIISSVNKKYKVQIDEENLSYNLLEFDLANNHKYKERYHFLEQFEGENLISDIVKYIKNKNKVLKVSGL